MNGLIIDCFAGGGGASVGIVNKSQLVDYLKEACKK